MNDYAKNIADNETVLLTIVVYNHGDFPQLNEWFEERLRFNFSFFDIPHINTVFLLCSAATNPTFVESLFIYMVAQKKKALNDIPIIVFEHHSNIEIIIPKKKFMCILTNKNELI